MNHTKAGFTLIELIVAVTLLALCLVGIAKVNFVLARRFYTLSGGAARDGVIAQQANQFAAVPFDSLSAKVGTRTFNTPQFSYTRKITVDSLSVKLRRVTITITPLNTIWKADTVVLMRTKPAKNPFNTP